MSRLNTPLYSTLKARLPLCTRSFSSLVTVTRAHTAMLSSMALRSMSLAANLDRVVAFFKLRKFDVFCFVFVFIRTCIEQLTHVAAYVTSPV